MKFSFLSNRVLALLGIRSEFQVLFFRNEFNTLAGKTWQRIRDLSIILFITCLALSFILGSLEILKKRMDDPYTNWVDLPIGRAISDETVKTIKSDFENQNLKDKFKIKSVKGYVIWPFKLVHQKSNTVYYRSGRSIDFSDDLIAKILEPSNLVAYPNGAEALQNDDCSVIVAEKLLHDLGYTAINGQQKIIMSMQDRQLSISIGAIVKFLPNKSDFVGSERLFALLEKDYFDRYSENYIEFLSPLKMTATAQKNISNIIDEASIYDMNAEPYKWNIRRPLYKYRVNFTEDYTPSQRKSILKLLHNDKTVKAVNVFDFACEEADINIEPYYLAINFGGDLSKIRPFQQYVLKNYENVEISMDQIESKNNFALVSSLTFITSLAFFIFGIISIGFYLFSLLKTHLDRLKPNLGTFKAFGLSDAFLTGIYVQIIVIFLSIAICISVLLCGFITLMDGLVSVEPHFRIFDWRLLLAITALFIGGVVICRNIVKKILMDTPGNLIYGRD
jgi:hypothetical protein